MDRAKLKVLIWVLIAAQLALIFVLSGQSAEGSGVLSDAVASEQRVITSKLVEGGIEPVDTFVKRHIRSMAHCVLYSTLALLIFVQSRAYGLNPQMAVATAVFCCFLYGVSDEFHQSFIPERTATVGDVLADTCGGLFGGLMSLLLEKMFGRRKK